MTDVEQGSTMKKAASLLDLQERVRRRTRCARRVDADRSTARSPLAIPPRDGGARDVTVTTTVMTRARALERWM